MNHIFCVRFKSLINYFYESISDCCFYFCTIFNDFLRSVAAKDCNYLHSISSHALPDRLLLSSPFVVFFAFNFSFVRHNFSSAELKNESSEVDKNFWMKEKKLCKLLLRLSCRNFFLCFSSAASEMWSAVKF